MTVILFGADCEEGIFSMEGFLAGRKFMVVDMWGPPAALKSLIKQPQGDRTIAEAF